MENTPRNILTVDVEEYFHPAEVQAFTQESEWSLHPSRIAGQTETILELLERHGVKATFFVLGWVAEHQPRAVRMIRGAGHEIGCHSYAHRLIYALRPEEFRRDTERAVAAIEDACGVTPIAYRAPNYSITRDSLWALDILASCGFTHDSSIYPIAHDRYGIPGFDRHAGILLTPSGPILEVPAATAQLWRRAVTPVGGGAYLRLLPYCYTSAGIRRINAEGKPACIYFHPWEIDPDQPRLARSRLARLRTYTGLGGMPGKLERLLRDFRFSSMQAVYPGPAPSRLASAVEVG
ncbi:MAG TPA: XrtA system polysaccharide deacetylase [Bryobacteraceae bacterium]|nr:XrtA system polysaccharide deacetylase [Bryobacteraceae bacterium]